MTTATTRTPYRTVPPRERSALVIRAKQEHDTGRYGPAAAALVESTIPLGLRLCSRRGIRGDAFDDAAQESALAAYEALRRFDPDRSDRPATGGFNTTFGYAIRSRLSAARKHAARYPFPVSFSAADVDPCDLDPPDDRTDCQEAAAAHELVAPLLDKLPPREREVVRRRFGIGTGDPETLVGIGRRMGVTKERVRQIEVQALGRLRGWVGEIVGDCGEVVNG